MTSKVEICECFLRDGLQHEEATIATATKVSLARDFVTAGFRRIEATSYGNPAQITVFADAGDVLAGLPQEPGLWFKATCPNVRAVERALADRAAGHGANEISLLVSATESHTRRNLRTDRAGQWLRVREMARLARGKFRIVGVISMAFGCPFEGEVDPGRVVEDAQRFAELGAELLTIGDTIGTASPIRVRHLFGRLRAEVQGARPVAHFHDTRGAGIANCIAALEAGCTDFDSAMGGVGGHPRQIAYGQGETGNVTTEDLVALLEREGVQTGIDMDAMMRASLACEAALGRKLNSKIARATAPAREDA